MQNVMAEQQAYSDKSLLLDAREQNVPRGVVTAHPLVIERAKGSEVWDVEGNHYLDFVGGIGVLNVGHNHPAVVNAVTRQLGMVSHACFQVVAYLGYITLAQRLNQLVGGDEAYKSVFFTSGVEAVGNAVKIARSYTQRPGITAQHGILLICNEVQTGFGHTGKMFAFQHLDIKPDLAPLVTTDSQLEETLHIFDIALASATGRLG